MQNFLNPVQNRDRPALPVLPLQSARINKINQSIELNQCLGLIPEDRLFYAYAPGKWTLAEVLQHVLDGERIFAYRCLCIARGEQQQLPSFDENSYSEHAVTSHRTLGSFLEEWSSIRQATISLLAHLHEGCLDNMGHAAGYPVQVRALPWIIAGHEVHHLQIIQERYL